MCIENAPAYNFDLIALNVEGTVNTENKTVEVILPQSKNPELWDVLNQPSSGDLLTAISLLGGIFVWFIKKSDEQKADNEATEQRWQELEWRRTQFIFEQEKLFTTNKNIVNAVKMISGNAGYCDFKKILRYEVSPIDYDGDKHHDLDMLLNFMDSLACSVIRGVMTLDELATFAWYYATIYHNDVLKLYCEDYYPPILKIAKIFIFVAKQLKVKNILNQLKKILNLENEEKLKYKKIIIEILNQVEEVLSIETLNRLKKELNVKQLNELEKTVNDKILNKLEKMLNEETLSQLEKRLNIGTLYKLKGVKQKLNLEKLNQIEKLLDRPFLLKEQVFVNHFLTCSTTIMPNGSNTIL